MNEKKNEFHSIFLQAKSNGYDEWARKKKLPLNTTAGPTRTLNKRRDAVAVDELKLQLAEMKDAILYVAMIDCCVIWTVTLIWDGVFISYEKI